MDGTLCSLPTDTCRCHRCWIAAVVLEGPGAVEVQDAVAVEEHAEVAVDPAEGRQWVGFDLDLGCHDLQPSPRDHHFRTSWHDIIP